MRTFAIINTHNDVNIQENIISKLKTNEKILVFGTKQSNTYEFSNVEYIQIPKDMIEYGSKIRNFVSKTLFDRQTNGFVHVLEDSIQILKDAEGFLFEIEKMMTKLKLNSWFNTETDVCNYTLKVYNPRFSVEIDEPSVKDVYSKKIFWTSHANTSWICYDYDNIQFEEMQFDESFKIPMFYIIKFLADRRNNKKDGELKYMNFYPTIDDERGVFKNIQINENSETSREQYEYENKKFCEMRINNQPDMSIESVMDDLFSVLKSQIN